MCFRGWIVLSNVFLLCALGVLLELLLEDVVIEGLLQMLVAEVDEELLQGVLLEALEASDVEDAQAPVDELLARRWLEYNHDTQ